MKKLLSLLSVLTISGTAIPTTIAASPYQKKEKITNIYFNVKHEDENFQMNYPYNQWKESYKLIDINIEKTNPNNYRYIHFNPYSDEKNIHTFVSWGNDRYSGKTINDVLGEKGFEIKKFIKNNKIENNNENIKENLNIVLQNNSYKNGLAWIDVKQKMGITYYFDLEKNEYHLQILIGQYVGPKWSVSGGRASICIGAELVLSN